MRHSWAVLAVAVGIAHDASSRDLPPCPVHFEVRPAAGRQVDYAPRRLQLSSCRSACTAEVRLCRAEATSGCVDAPVRTIDVQPSRRLESVAPSDEPLCSDWLRIALPARAGASGYVLLRGETTLAGVPRPLRDRLRVACRRAGRAACDLDTLPPDAAYDVACSGANIGSIGRIEIDLSRRVRIRLHQTALTYTDLEGPIRQTPVVQLDGTRVDGGDALSPVTGYVRFEVAEGNVIANLTLDWRAGEVTCRMSRPAAGTSPAFGGQRLLRLDDSDTRDAPTELELALDLQPSGVVLSPRAIHRDESAGVIGRADGGMCLVTPQRRLWCELRYLAAPPAGEFAGLYLFGAIGQLPSDSSDGQYYIASPPSSFGAGVWRDVTPDSAASGLAP